MAYAPITVNPTSLSFSKDSSSRDITVSCADTTWTVGGGSSWCTITKLSNTKARITVTANSGNRRTMGVVCVNGSSVASISIEQAGANVTYDRTNMITAYQQPFVGACATTCAAMCVNRSPATLENDKIDLGYAYWGTIASKYGYTLDPSSGPATCTIREVFNGLKNGYPVIVKVNNTALNSTYKYDHWVVVTKYTGKGESDLAIDNFTCVDPNDKTTKPLSSAACFTGVYKYLIYKK